METYQDIPKLYTALAEWLACFGTFLLCRAFRRKKQWPFAILLSLPLLCGIQLLCGKLSGIVWLLGMLIAWAVMLLTVHTSLETNWKESVFLSARGFMLAEMVAALEWQLDAFLNLSHRFSTPVASLLFCLAFYSIVFSVHFYMEYLMIPKGMSETLRGVTNGQLAVTCFVTALCFSLGNLGLVVHNLPFSGTTPNEIFVIRALFDVIGVALLLGLNLQRIGQISFRETYAIESMMQTQYRQYLAAEQNRELIHQKYHDLKHQLHILRAEMPDKEKEQRIAEFEESIRDFETTYETGNAVLDAILSDKGMACSQKGIPLTVFADGALLNPLLTMDICSIFGNALDNAIEYEERVSDPALRYIKVEVHRVQSFVCILIENYYQSEPLHGSELPQTTKPEKDYHGYGLKSIRRIAEKMNGTMVVQTADNAFRLKILFPSMT